MVMIVNCISSPVWYHYLYGALLFVSTRRIWPLEVSHLTKVNLIHLLSLLKNQQRSVIYDYYYIMVRGGG